MKHLLNISQGWQDRMRKYALMLFLDYDGTLTPIVKFPDKAKLSSGMKKILETLLTLDEVRLAIVSGRSLEQVKAFVGIPEATYVGSYGLEVEGPDIKYIHPGAVSGAKLMGDIADRLKSAFDKSSGVIIEDKTYTVSIHYRLAKEENLEKNWRLLLKILFPYLEEFLILLSQGKKVWEIRPAVEWNKASAMLWLAGHFSESLPKRPLSMYIGDDKADEACFAIMGISGFGVRVTENPLEPTDADYYLRNTDELYEFLKIVIELKSKNGRP